MPLDPAALAALHALTRVLGPDTPMVIVGATVPLVLLDRRGAQAGGRVRGSCLTLAPGVPWTRKVAVAASLEALTRAFVVAPTGFEPVFQP